MADEDLAMGWQVKVDHVALTLVVPATVVWLASVLSEYPGEAGQNAGAVLELLGFAVAAYGLQEKVAQVTDRPGLGGRIAGRFHRWWRRIKMAFGWKPDPIVLKADPVEVSMSMGGGRLKISPGPDTPLDRRVEILEQELEAVHSRIDEVEREARDDRSSIRDEIARVRDDLRAVEDELEDLVRRLAIGSLHWETTGLFWFAVGVVVSTWPGSIPGAP